MDRPTPRKARERKANIEARLRNATQIHSTRLWDVYRSDRGYYVVRYRQSEVQTTYIAITQDGGVHDMVGYPVDEGDVMVAIDALRSAGGLDALVQKVRDWPKRPHQ